MVPVENGRGRCGAKALARWNRWWSACGANGGGGWGGGGGEG